MDSREPREDHELAACPFCGAPAVLIMEGRRAPVYSARCDNAKCAVMPEIDSRSKAKAIAAWNRRPSPVAESTPTDATAVEAEREELLSLRAFRDRILAAVAFAPPLDDQAAGRIADDLRSGLSLRQCARKHGVTIGIVRGIRARTPKES